MTFGTKFLLFVSICVPPNNPITACGATSFPGYHSFPKWAIKSIKDGFPYFNVFDEVMGHRDSVDPSKMAIEGSATFTNSESGASNAVADVPEISMNSSNEEAPSTATDMGEKRKTDEKSRSKVKRKKRDVKDGDIAPEWQTKFFEMWERSMEEDNARYERSAEMFREAQNKQMEQTNAILAGFKDIFKDLAPK